MIHSIVYTLKYIYVYHSLFILVSVYFNAAVFVMKRLYFFVLWNIHIEIYLNVNETFFLYISAYSASNDTAHTK